MLKYLKEETNFKETENGALTHETSLSNVLDLFAQCGALRNRREDEIIKLFTKAFSEDSLLSMKVLFYTRGIRQGLGERRTFRIIIKYLADNHTEIMRKNINLISEFGRFDDILCLLDTKLYDDVINLIKIQLKKDLDIKNECSLLGKWLPSENASSMETKRLAKKVRMGLGLTPRLYRKTLSQLRERINILETKITQKDYKSIDYSHIPSCAGLQYRSAFWRNDEERYIEFLNNLSTGEVKVNSKTLFPYQLVEKVFGNPEQYDIDLMNGMWNNLPDYIGDNKDNCIAVVDTSGSMYGTPLYMAISLGLYLAEKNKGEFGNHFITFASKPQLVQIQGSNLYEKTLNIARADWGGSTNIKATFDLILNTAFKNNLPQSELPSKIFIISDMEFDECGYENYKTNFDCIKDKFIAYGYEMPRLVFWNVDSRQDNIPMTMNDDGVQLVSGANPYLFELLLKNKFIGAYELMIQELNKEIYDDIRI